MLFVAEHKKTGLRYNIRDIEDLEYFVYSEGFTRISNGDFVFYSPCAFTDIVDSIFERKIDTL